MKIERKSRLASGALTFAVAGALCLAPATGAFAGTATTGAQLTTTAAAAPTAVAVKDGELMNYVVNTATGAEGIAAATAAVTAAGGTVVMTYPEIGVTVAQSTSAAFQGTVQAAAGIESAGPTRTAAVTEGAASGTPGTLSIHQPSAEAAIPGIPTEGNQWDQVAIGSISAHGTETGDGVLVGVVDSGIDITNPDLAGQVDAAASVGCTTNGVPNTAQSAWVPTTSDHGTHVAGTIAAADNGAGVVGVAPGAKLASVKVVSDDGFIYPEYAICGFMWSATHGIDVANHSYYVDPWQFWCTDAADQKAGLEAVRRAVEYSTDQGVLNVAAAGNSDYDLANKTIDTDSPNDTTPVPDRPINAGCLDIPTEVEGVVSVASLALTPSSGAISKSSFSNYGRDKIDVAAPGSGIWSTITANAAGDIYGSKNGTSMASPHVAGVAALLAATNPSATPAQLEQLLKSQATPLACPTGDARCAEPRDFYGAGMVNAAAAAGVAPGAATEASIGVQSKRVRPGTLFGVVADGFQPDEQVTFTVGTQVAKTVAADALGRVNTSVNLSAGAADGEYPLTATGTSGKTATVTMTAFTLAAPTLAAPTVDQVVTADSVTVTGKGAPGATVQVELYDSVKFPEGPVTRKAQATPAAAKSSSSTSADQAAADVPFDPAAGWVFGQTTAGADGSFSVTFTGLPDGDFLAYALQTDGSQVSAYSAGVAFSVDTAVVAPEPTPVPTDGATPLPTAPGVDPAPAAGTPVASNGSGSLPATGADVSLLVGGAGLLAVLGLLFAGFARRRSAERTKA